MRLFLGCYWRLIDRISFFVRLLHLFIHFGWLDYQFRLPRWPEIVDNAWLFSVFDTVQLFYLIRIGVTLYLAVEKNLVYLLVGHLLIINNQQSNIIFILILYSFIWIFQGKISVKVGFWSMIMKLNNMIAVWFIIKINYYEWLPEEMLSMLLAFRLRMQRGCLYRLLARRLSLRTCLSVLFCLLLDPMRPSLHWLQVRRQHQSILELWDRM